MSTTEGVWSIELICGLGMIQEHTTGLQSAAHESCPCRRGAAQPALPSRIPPGGTGPRLVAWALGWVGACAVAAASIAAPTIPTLQGGSTAGNRSRWQGARGSGMHKRTAGQPVCARQLSVLSISLHGLVS